jgi:RNA polymerase sigma-70 factor, ECF subfamily
MGEGVATTSDFERLTMPHLADVARFARSLTRDEARADDLVQDTYLQAMRGWHTFQPGSDPRRWLFTVCHNMFLRTIRREARYVDAPDDDPELDSLATAKAHWHATVTGVAEIVERMDLSAAIDRALATLPEHHRGVVVLVDVEGQSYEEAAGVLGIALGTVRSRLFRARRTLQDLLFDHARDAQFTTAPGAAPDPSPNAARSAGDTSHPRRSPG